MPLKRDSNGALSKRQYAARIKKDAAAKARTLKKYGLAEFRGKLSAESMTPKRIKRIETLFNDAQKKHPVYVRGKTERMFYRPDPRKDYVLNESHFRFLKSNKPAPSQAGVIKTARGNIVSTTDKNANIIGVTNDDTIIIDQNGTRAYTGRMSDKQILQFVRDVETGKFKLPKNYRLGVTYFQNDNGERSYNTIAELRKDIRKYDPKISEIINLQYPNFETLKLTFYQLSQREIDLNEKRERKNANERARRKKVREENAKKKNRRYRSRN